MRQSLLVVFAMILFIRSNAQVGPNLAAGSGGLVLNQGELDAQVILDIIATKKGEIKTELGKRLILNKLEGSSYALYSYAEKNLNLLFSQSSSQVITKELMENSAELLLVYGLAEYILQDMKFKATLTKEEDSLLVFFSTQLDKSNFDSLRTKFPNITIHEPPNLDNSGYLSTMSQKTYTDGNKSNVTVTSTGIKAEYDESKYLLKPDITKYLNNKYRNKYLESHNNYYTAMSMFADLIYDVCIKNDQVKSTGMFQSNNTDNVRYKALSKYLYFEKYPVIFKPLSDYRPKIDSIVTCLFGYYNLLKQVKNLYDTDRLKLDSLINSIVKLDIDGADKLLADLKSDITTIQSNGKSSEANKIYEDEIGINERIQNLSKYLPRIIDNNSFKDRVSFAKRYLDLAYTIQKEIIPKLSTISSIREGKYSKVLETSQKLSTVLFDNGLYLFGKDTNHIYSIISTLRNYMPLLDIINNLDRVESYDYMFKFLTGIAETIGDERTKAVVQGITTAVNKYTTIDKDGNKIQIDVEGIALGMYEKFSRNQHGRINMLFTVGANHNTSTSDNLRFINDNSSNPDSVGYSMFFSEKIGLQWSIIDWNRRRAFHHYNIKGNISRHQAAKMEINPIVNNLHMILYGSGILYQVEAFNSDDNFTQPIIGTGLGVTFFNGLNFNASYATTYSSFKRGFISLSFDIAITEYLGAIRAKNKKQ